MSALKQAVQGFRNIWGHGDDDDYAPDELEERDANEETPRESSSYREPARGEKYEKYTAPPASAYSSPPPSTGGGSGAGARKLRSVAMPIRAAREKNIYTLKPKNIDEASLAADYLKTGSAVVLNLDEVEKVTAVRIIDFMSGVCYGLENQGHAMKLGETIFLFTPGDFEISSDETDYGENREFIFKEVAAALAAAPDATSPPAMGAMTAPAPSAYASPERRSWER